MAQHYNDIIFVIYNVCGTPLFCCRSRCSLLESNLWTLPTDKKQWVR